MKQELFERYSRLIVNVETEDFQRREGIELYKAKLILADGSNLRVSEVSLDGTLTKYAYYWLDEQNELIQGWDNAPHHPRVDSHPHHSHKEDGILESPVRSLEDVLEFLNKELEVKDDEI
ncbi:MAG: hypothetical protein EYC68_05175 [Chloroflexota bacterium]|nr:MAG: hypothetical protein EYC68_05175 [Chloroflexota bacterium]